MRDGEAVFDESVSRDPSHLEAKFRFSRCLPRDANSTCSLNRDFALWATSLNMKHQKSHLVTIQAH